MATTSDRCTIWVHGEQDESDDEVGFLEEGEPIFLLGPKVHWPEESSLAPDGHYMHLALTRLGLGWINDSDFFT